MTCRATVPAVSHADRATPTCSILAGHM